jgi:uncharacterized protein YuzE
MKLNYYPETDSPYLDLSEKQSVESREISEGIVLDHDGEGQLVGIDIDNASKKIQLKELTDQCHNIVDTLKCQNIEDSPRCPDTLQYILIAAYS